MKSRLRIWGLVLLSSLSLNCKTSDAPALSDAGIDPGESPPDLLGFKSNCGWPGDKGNELGVGKFCLKIEDCGDNPKAIMCTTLGDNENFFCTFRCSKTGPADQCGKDARCACSDGGCGCMPARCLGDEPADGGTDAASTPDLAANDMRP
ncbi:MAG TPA: hypothetical protein PKI03_22835 [Pseudomonadota bacterium]|nr:hypothetical protein [Pseudomonadota bacterium]